MKFQCPHCRKSLNVKDALAGKKGKCPACGGAITIPEPEIGVLPDGPLQQEQTPSQEQGIGPAASGEACPKCFQPMAADAVVCIQCGYDTRTKKTLQTEFGADEPPGEIRVLDDPREGTAASQVDHRSGGLEPPNLSQVRLLRTRSRSRTVLVPSAIWFSVLIGGLLCLFLLSFFLPRNACVSPCVGLFMVSLLALIPVALITRHLARRLLGIDAPWWVVLLIGPCWYYLFASLRTWAETYTHPKSVSLLRLVACAFSLIFGVLLFLVSLQVSMDTGNNEPRAPFGVSMLISFLLMAGLFFLVFRKNTVAVGIYGLALLLNAVIAVMAPGWLPAILMLACVIVAVSSPAVVSLVRRD